MVLAGPEIEPERVCGRNALGQKPESELSGRPGPRVRTFRPARPRERNFNPAQGPESELADRPGPRVRTFRPAGTQSPNFRPGPKVRTRGPGWRESSDSGCLARSILSAGISKTTLSEVAGPSKIRIRTGGRPNSLARTLKNWRERSDPKSCRGASQFISTWPMRSDVGIPMFSSPADINTD
jgi:hypothetical protein